MLTKSAYHRGMLLEGAPCAFDHRPTPQSVPASSPEAALLEKVRVAGEKLQQARPHLDKATEYIVELGKRHGIEVKIPTSESDYWEQRKRAIILSMM